MQSLLNDIAKKIYFYCFLTTLVMVFLLWIIQLLNYMNFITNANLTTSFALGLSMLLVPEIMVFLLPMTFSVSVAVVYTRYRATNQIIAAFFNGYGYRTVLDPVIKTGGVLSIILCLNSFYIAPMCIHIFFSFKKQFSESFIIPNEKNIINYQNVSLFFENKNSKNDIQNVVIHDKRNKNKFATLMADSASISSSNNQIAVTLEHGNKLNFKDSRMSKLNFKKYVTYINKKNTIFLKDYREKTLHELLFSGNIKDFTTANQKIISPVILILNGLFVAFMILISEFSKKHKLAPYIYGCLFVVMTQIINILIMKVSVMFVFNNIWFYILYFYAFKRMVSYLDSL